MRGLGRGIREFKDAKDNVKKEIEAGINDKTEGSYTKE
jgi:sec-independent protein translocase protein TatA